MIIVHHRYRQTDRRTDGILWLYLPIG